MAYYNYTQNPYLYTGNPYTYTDNPYPYPHAYPVPSSSAPSYPYPPVIPTTRYDYHRSCVRARPSARLPVELYRQIIQHLRDYRSDLMTLMVTSRTIRMEAEQVLYGYVALADPRAQRLFCRQILAHPRLALLVRRYHFSTEHQSKHIGMVERDATEQGVQLLSRVLPMFTGLKDLKFSFQPEGEGCPAYILDNCTFELESFEWDSDCCTEKLVPFLRKRQLYGLRHLDLITWPSGLSPSGLWPNLMSLGGGDDTIAAVLPRGRISQLRWHSTVSPEELKQKICPDRLLHNVRILSFSHDLTLKEQRTVFRFLGTLFPNLQILEDVRYCTLGDYGIKVDGGIMTSLDPKCFPNLRTLIFSAIRYLGYDAPEHSAQGKVAKKIFRKWPSLRQIDIIHHLCRDAESDLEDEIYERWLSHQNCLVGIKRTTLVTADKVTWWR